MSSINAFTAGTPGATNKVLGSLASTSDRISDIQNQLSTNKKTLDPAQQGVVTRLTSQVTGYSAAQNNIARAQNVLSVASTGLTSIADLLTKMQDLANKANDSTMTSSDAAKLNQTFQHLLQQIDSTAKGSKIDGTGLLTNTGSNLSIQTGLSTSDTTTISNVGADSVALSIGSHASASSVASTASSASVASVASAAALSITDMSSAAAAITALKTALDSVSTSQSSVAADKASLTTVSDQAASISKYLQNTIDSIEKPDAAALQVELQNANNQQSINYYLINQMNQEAQGVLSIFR